MSATRVDPQARAVSTARRPRLGFVGLGWIGRHRMKAVIDDGAADVVAVCDSSPEALEAAARDAGGAALCSSVDEVLDAGVDGVVIATPSALHAAQSIAALEAGAAVFSQKPLARTLDECDRVLDAARRAGRLLGVDLSYRRVHAFEAVLQLARRGDLGPLHAVDLVFHNAYGPDKAWFSDPDLSGGGCVIDLGTHLIDLALAALSWAPVTDLTARLYRQGRALDTPPTETEDFALVEFVVRGGPSARLACSWFAPAGRDAVIEARFFGRDAGAGVTNVAGSFYDFRAERYAGTKTEVLVEPPDEWGGRVVVDWTRRLAENPSYDPAVETYRHIASVIDAIYGRSS